MWLKRLVAPNDFLLAMDWRSPTVGRKAGGV
uniref:Uncharacterized protein n=1 Tax=Anguilla anguilla TaxID=7936 RepID=A0A0E9SDI9_ANGAN